MKKKLYIKKVLKSIFSLLIFTTPLLFFNNNPLFADKEKDLILVLDTSLSMAGFGGKNILPEVKESLPQYIEQLEEDDSVTFITFDTQVKLHPTIYIDDEKNKKSLVEYVKGIKASGKWTYTSEMIKAALKKAQELDEKDKKRQKVIVIMTDALDDPPPDKRHDKLNIKEIAKSYKGKDWFIFFLNLGEAHKNEKLVNVQKELKKTVSRYTKIIEAKESPSKGIEEDLAKNIKEMKEKRVEKEGFSFTTLFIALLVIAIVLLTVYYFKIYSALKVKGKLEYWDNTILNPFFENFDLDRLNVKEVLVGKLNKHHLTIRDLEITEPFKIKAVRENGKIQNSLEHGSGIVIEYVNREPSGNLKNGDIFKIANYTFKYTSS